MKRLLVIAALALAVGVACDPSSSTTESLDLDDLDLDVGDTTGDSDYPPRLRDAFLDGCIGNAPTGYRACECALEEIEDAYPNPLDLPDPNSPAGQALLDDSFLECLDEL